MRELSAAAQNCPLAPPEHASVHSRALHRACLIVGGIEHLARRLEVSAMELEQWMRGMQSPPERAFLESVEIILLYAGGAGRAN